jgi:chromosome segregation ATPase
MTQQHQEDQMGAIAAAPEVLLEQYDKLTRYRARLVDQIDQAETRLSTLESERQALLPRVADGDKSASMHADLLDTAKLHGQRQIDGLKIKLAEVEGAIAGLNEPRRAIYEKSANEARAKHFAELKQAIETRLYNVHARYRTQCRERFELSEQLFRIASDPALDEGQKNFLRTMVAQAEADLVPLWINERWELARGPLSEIKLRIFPAKPSDDKRHLEELK